MTAKETKLLRAIAGSVLTELNHIDGQAFVEPLLRNPQGDRSRLDEVLRHHHRVAILGPAGSGKSVLLSYRAISSAEAYLAGISGARCPLLVRARDLEWSVSDNRRGMGSLIRGNMAADDWQAILRSGACELLVDGGDEASTQGPTLASLGDLAAAHPSLAIVVTSRPAQLRAELRDFATYFIAPFDRPQIIGLITQLAGPPSTATDSFRAALSAAPALSSIATQPLFLRLLWDLFEARGQLPATRAILIADAIDALMRREDIRTRYGEQGLSTETRFHIFGRLATRMYEAGAATISRHDIKSEIASQEHSIDLEAATVNLVSAPWLMTVAEGCFSFTHGLFQFYFIARHHRSAPDTLLKLVSADETNRGEILDIAAGLVDDVAPLVDGCLRCGWLIDAAKCLGNARIENQALCAHVANVFRQSVPSVVLKHLAPSLLSDPQSVPKLFDHYTLMHQLEQACDKALPNHRRGAEFEAFTEAFFAPIFKQVRRDCRTESGEIDLILELEVRRQSPFCRNSGLMFSLSARICRRQWSSRKSVISIPRFVRPG